MKKIILNNYLLNYSLEIQNNDHYLKLEFLAKPFLKKWFSISKKQFDLIKKNENEINYFLNEFYNKNLTRWDKIEKEIVELKELENEKK